jgi:hypothetical protein
VSELDAPGAWAAELYGLPADDALIAFDRDLMRGDGLPAAAAGEMALQHARDRAVRDNAGGPYRTIYDTHPADEAIRLAVGRLRSPELDAQSEAGQ